MEVKSSTRFIRVSPRRTREVIKLIKGARVNDALSTVNFTNTKAAKIVGKTLKSAIANAKEAEVENLDGMFVKAAFVDEGPIMRRFIARAMGRATRIRKRTCHITIVLSDGTTATAHRHNRPVDAKAHETAHKETHEKDTRKNDLNKGHSKDTNSKFKGLQKLVRTKDTKKIGAQKKGM